jgi:hypothetical protein
MEIVIPTLGRAAVALQHTLRQLIAANLPVTLVVQPQEYELYNKMISRVPEWSRVRIEHMPARVKGIAATRDWIINDMYYGDHKVLMLDDDLHFAVRREDDRTKFRQPESSDIYEMVQAIDGALDAYPHVSIGSREGGNRVTEEFCYNTRMMRVLAYDRAVLRKHNIAFSVMDVMEDFHVTLSLLREGHDCLVLNNWVSNQAGGSAAKGGCSTFRTPELQAENAYRLAARHPGFVKVVKKATKTAWGGGERTDVTVSWKKAAAAGKVLV